MFVMHFVGSADGIKVRVLDIAQPFEASVDIDVVDQKISQTISGNAKANPDREVHLIHESEHNTEPRRDGVNEKEDVVFLKKTGFYLMVVFVEIPHDAMHDEFVRCPRHKFHPEESCECNNRTPPHHKRKFKKVKKMVM
jgi:hypothetical protein